MKDHQLRVTPVRRDPIDLDALVAALLRLVDHLAEADSTTEVPAAVPQEPAA